MVALVALIVGIALTNKSPSGSGRGQRYIRKILSKTDKLTLIELININIATESTREIIEKYRKIMDKKRLIVDP